MSNIKHDPELRHVLSHIMNAIEHLAHGSTDAALHELESIEGLVFWESDEEMRVIVEGDYDGERRREEAATETLSDETAPEGSED